MMLGLMIRQAALFTECLLELMDIHFEHSERLSDRRVQQQGSKYLRVSSKDAVSQLFHSAIERTGVFHCWLSVLLLMWAAFLSISIAFEFGSSAAITIATTSKAFLIEQYHFFIRLFQELWQVSIAQWQSFRQWQATSPAFRIRLRQLKPSLTLE